MPDPIEMPLAAAGSRDSGCRSWSFKGVRCQRIRSAWGMSRWMYRAGVFVVPAGGGVVAEAVVDAAEAGVRSGLLVAGADVGGDG
jgi:hypothetical protein